MKLASILSLSIFLTATLATAVHSQTPEHVRMCIAFLKYAQTEEDRYSSKKLSTSILDNLCRSQSEVVESFNTSGGGGSVEVAGVGKIGGNGFKTRQDARRTISNVCRLYSAGRDSSNIIRTKLRRTPAQVVEAATKCAENASKFGVFATAFAQTKESDSFTISIVARPHRLPDVFEVTQVVGRGLTCTWNNKPISSDAPAQSKSLNMLIQCIKHSDTDVMASITTNIGVVEKIHLPAKARVTSATFRPVELYEASEESKKSNGAFVIYEIQLYDSRGNLITPDRASGWGCSRGRCYGDPNVTIDNVYESSRDDHFDQDRVWFTTDSSGAFGALRLSFQPVRGISKVRIRQASETHCYSDCQNPIPALIRKNLKQATLLLNTKDNIELSFNNGSIWVEATIDSAN